MRKTYTTTIILLLLFFGCQRKSSDHDSKEKELLEKEIELLKKEKELLQEQHTKEKNASPLVDQDEIKIEEVEDDKQYKLLDQSVGKFKIGSPIPFPSTSDDYKINKETQTRMTEEGPEEETIYSVIIEGKEMMQLQLEYDYNTGQYTQEIAEIILTSSVVKTQGGIGVGSTIEDFIEQYPDYDLWYTYVSGMYVIETKDVKAQFILNEEDFIGKLNITGDMITLKKSDFKPGAKILKVRVI